MWKLLYVVARWWLHEQAMKNESVAMMEWISETPRYPSTNWCLFLSALVLLFGQFSFFIGGQLMKKGLDREAMTLFQYRFYYYYIEACIWSYFISVWLFFFASWMIDSRNYFLTETLRDCQLGQPPKAGHALCFGI